MQISVSHSESHRRSAMFVVIAFLCVAIIRPPLPSSAQNVNVLSQTVGTAVASTSNTFSLNGSPLENGSAPIQAMFTVSNPHSDDKFGMFWDPNVPSNSYGIQVHFSINTSHMNCLNNQGSISPVDTVRVKAGSPNEWLLQAGVTFACTGSGTSE